MKFLIPLLAGLLLFSKPAETQPTSIQGKLFIIGGGIRPPVLLRSLLTASGLGATDYIVVLPMASAEPDSSYLYFKEDMATVCNNPVVNFNLAGPGSANRNWLDSLEKAKLVFITGGDQDRFMGAVLHTAVYAAIHKAYRDGATIAGTSAGAAVMSQYMITGQQLKDSVYRSTFPRIQDKNIEIKEGLGLLTRAVVDQHFIVRSRYNRLFSALAKFPTLTCIGIDEATAIIVHRNEVKVAGTGQVVVIGKPEDLRTTKEGLIKMKELRFSIYTAGDEFTLDK